MTGLWLRVDPATLARALETPQDCDEVLKAAALRKSVLLGETSEPIDSNEANLAAALASPANPYGSAKHGVFDAASAAEVAEDVPSRPDCATCEGPHLDGMFHAPIEPFPHFPHLAEHVGGNPVCIICGIDHDAAARLAPPAGYQLPSASIPGDGA